MPPLSALLTHAFLDINRSFERTAAEVGEESSLLTYSDFLRVVPDDGIEVGELPAATRISRRAIQSWLRLEKRGWLEIESTAPRVKVVRPTERARQTRDRCAELVVTTDDAWCVSIGVDEAKSLRVALEALVSRLDLELAHYPMTYGGSDISVLGGPWVAAKAGPPRIPAHGADWVPVVRGDGDTVSGLPLHALLSQALVAFLIDYEDRARFPMFAAAQLADTMPAGKVPLVDLPPILGVTGAGKSGLERHGIVRVTGSGDRRIASLTPVGTQIRDAYVPTVAGIGDGWDERYGTALVADLRAALERVDEKLDDDLPDHVVVRHKPFIGFRDVSLTAEP